MLSQWFMNLLKGMARNYLRELNKNEKKISTNFISGDREFTKQYGAEIRYAVQRLSIKNVRHENGCGTIFCG